jgi:hypothetical protein
MFQDIIDELKSIDNSSLSEIYEYNENQNIEIDVALKSIGYKFFVQEKKAVLGYDIYRYSQYEEEKQKFIPFIFDLIYNNAILYVNSCEPTLFCGFNKNIISTGDGGFILFSEPFRAFLFNIYFYMSLHLFNTGHLYPKLSHYVGEIVIRSAITHDNIYSYENNFYGKGIINNARILKRDRLNRFLIDKNTYNYFEKKFNGIESIQVITKENIKKSLNIKKDIISYIFDKLSYNPINEYYKNKNIYNIHVQKIEETFSKETFLTIYNIEIQIYTTILSRDNHDVNTSYVFTIGNSTPL